MSLDVNEIVNMLLVYPFLLKPESGAIAGLIVAQWAPQEEEIEAT
jgi:hypothetical protein